MSDGTNAMAVEAAPSRPIALFVFLWPAALLMAALATQTLWRGAAAVAFPYQVDREEGFLLDQATRLLRGGSIYPPLDDYPYTVGNYPPAYPALFAAASLVGGKTLGAGRVVALLAAGALLGGLAWRVWRRGGRVVLAVLAPALVLATFDFNQWIAYARVDVPALALAFWGLLRFARDPARGGARGTAALLALALLTRQTMLAAPLAVICALLHMRQFGGLKRFLIAFVAWTAGAYVLLFLVTGGRAWSHLVTYNANPYHWNQTVSWARHLWLFQRFLIVTTVLIFVIEPSIRLLAGPADAETETGDRAAADDAGVAPLETYYLLFAFASFFLIGKEGASVNYLLEFHVATAFFVAEHCARIERWGRGDRVHHAVRLLFVLIFLCLSLHGAHLLKLSLPLDWSRGLPFAGIVFNDPPPREVERLTGLEIEEALAGARGEILADEPIYAIRAGSPVLFQPFIMSELSRQGLWDQGRFVADLRGGRFAALVVTQDMFNEDQYFWAWTPEMRAAIRAAYKQRARIDHGRGWRYWVYVPKAAP